MKKGLFVILIVFILSLSIASAAELNVPGDHATIQGAIDAAGNGDTINVAAGTYAEVLNLGAKELTILGAGIDTTFIDASALSGYAISNFGDHCVVKDLTLIGTTSSYGFKISHVNDINLTNIKVLDSRRTGIDLHTINGAILTNLEVKDTVGGFGLMILDSNNIVVNGITTSGNPWGGVSVQAVSVPLDNITFLGDFNAAEGIPLLIEKDPNYPAISNIIVPEKFKFVLYGFRTPDNYMQWMFKENYSGIKALADFLKAGFTYDRSFATDILNFGTTINDTSYPEFMIYSKEKVGFIPLLGADSIVKLGDGTFPGGIVIDVPLTITQGSVPIIDCEGTGNGFTINADGVTIEGIEIINCDNGIELNNPNFNSINNSIHNNVIGILVNGGAGTATINGNNIFDNSNLGISNLGSNVLNAEANWWGHYSGPYKASTNPSGQGNAISNNVAYDPWLCEEIESTWLTVGGICDADEDGYAPSSHGGTDCDDSDSDVYPGNSEVCDDKDNDCDGHIDNGLGMEICQGTCELFGSYDWTENGGSFNCCGNDADEASPFEAVEVTCDGNDNDCDGGIDEGVKTTYYRDQDGDTYGNNADSVEACSAPSGYVLDNTDCVDNNDQINPGMNDVCNGVNDDCDGLTDDGSGEVTPLNDRQSGVCVNSEKTCDTTWKNDYSSVVNYEEPDELTCDTLDNDCDGTADEGTKTKFYLDSDSDLYGNNAEITWACSAPLNYVLDNTDCDDSNTNVNPGAQEVCNGIDDDCDTFIDEEDANSCLLFYRDQDGDTYGLTSDSRCLCDLDGLYNTNTDGDCNDANDQINPGMNDVCNDVDDDCNAGTADGSGEATPLNDRQSGVCDSSEKSCTAGNWVNDYSGIATYEEPNELTCDTLDNDCDGAVDETLLTLYYRDQDGDLFGNIADSQEVCSQPPGYVENNTDCVDNDDQINPGMVEACNGIDDNCDTVVDEGFPDNDGDFIADCVDDDDDNDGILDDGDTSGVIGDNFCEDEETVNCDDNCQFIVNPGQGDNDADGIGDDCDDDDDNDGILDVNDNCHWIFNPGQTNTDEFLPNGDLFGDDCDDDDDGDGILDVDDPWPLIPNEGPVVTYVVPAEHTWFKEDFEVSFSDSDMPPDVFTCEYRVLQKRAAAAPAEQWMESKEWTFRENQGTVLVTVGENKNCFLEGYDYCKVESRCTDEWGLQGPMADRFFSIDMSGPRIHDLSPLGITGDATPRIEGHWNDRGSGIDLSSAVIKLNGIDVTPAAFLMGDRFFLDILVGLPEGEHLVEVQISDNLGTSSALPWTFKIDLTLPNLEVNSPEDIIYEERRIDIDLDADEMLKEIRMSKDHGNFRSLCTNCDSYFKSSYFTDGEHILEFEAEDFAGNIEEEEVTFFVDSRPPRVYDFWPDDEEIIHGTEFGIKYTEQENLDYVKLFWQVDDEPWNETDLDCDTGRSEECVIDMDLAMYDGSEIHYYFELRDDINVVKTEIRTLYVDNSAPVLTIFEPSFVLQESRRVLFDLETDEPAKLSYSIDGTRYRTLCRNCDSYYGYKTFRDGDYKVWIKAEDEIGNDYKELIEFEIDSRKPRIYSTLPRTKYVDNGNFIVSYSEDNLQSVTLHLGDQPYPGVCKDGQRQECIINGDIGLFDGQEVDYYFEIEDIFGNIVKSRPRTIIPDVTDPVITILSPEDNETYNSYVNFNIELSEKVKKLWYEDLDTGYTRTLCTNCDSYNRRKRFRDGEYSFNFIAEDFVGNTNDLDLSFVVN
jgi:hypothetical protein